MCVGVKIERDIKERVTMKKKGRWNGKEETDEECVKAAEGCGKLG